MNLLLLLMTLSFFYSDLVFAQSAMINISGRSTTLLNGQWQVIIDPAGAGDWKEVWKEKKPEKKTDFTEYSFEGGPVLNVPGDFNTQMPELIYYEGTVWYKKTFINNYEKGKRLFIHFGAVNYKAGVYLNGKILGTHEGGFTPFQFEITNEAIPGVNRLIVKVNNERIEDGIPGTGFDWLNYGGITRDVHLIETGSSFVEDYFIQLQKNSINKLSGWIKINGNRPVQDVNIKIPELNIEYKTRTNKDGFAEINFSAEPVLWSPGNPRLYKIKIQSETDSVSDEIGFRSIEVKDAKILLNGKPVFLRGVNIHEENPLKPARAFSKEDALLLLNWAKELGCNFIRLAHYPHNEYMISEAEKTGLMVWEELPVYQHIQFVSPGVFEKIDLMLREMIRRDRNRCSVIFWSFSNETFHFTENRNSALISLSQICRQLDSTRLTVSVINNQGYDENTFNIWDSLYKHFDIIALNEYLGWYVPWQGKPEEVKWKFLLNDKPVVITEFGGEALYGSNYGPKDEAAYWSEEYQEQIYKDQIEMFKTVPNLAGVCPWLLADYRSPGRLHPVYQNGWNRKGLLSEKGEKKKSWYVMKNYYELIKNRE